MKQQREWVMLVKKAKGTARWSKQGLTRTQINECSNKFAVLFKDNAADPTRGKAQLKELNDMFDQVAKEGDSLHVGWEQTKKMNAMSRPMQDKICGGHWIPEELT